MLGGIQIVRTQPGGRGGFKMRTAEYRGGGGVWAMSMYAKLVALWSSHMHKILHKMEL